MSNRKTFMLLLISGVLFSALFSFNYQFRHSIDCDTFWHIKTGEYIYTHGSVPTHDIFSWYGAENNLRWINHEWLYDLIVFYVHHALGMYGVIIFTSILAGLIFLALYKLIEIRSQNPLLSLFLSLLGICGLTPFVIPRPQSISYLLLLTAAVLMERKKYFWVLPLVVIGVNLHGGFYPMYILLMAYYLWREKPSMILFAALSVMINPYGAEMIAYPFKVQMYPEFSRYIAEWVPTKLTGRGNQIHLMTYLLLLVSVFNKKVKTEDALFSLLLAVQTLTSARHVAFLYLLLIPVLSPYIAMNGIFNYRFSQLNEDRIKTVFTGLIVLIFILFAFSTDFHREIPLNGYPKEAVHYIKQNNLDRICNMYGDGGFLIYNGIKPLIDGRADIFAPVYNNTKLFGDYSRFFSLEEDFKIMLDKYNINYLLINKNEQIYRAMVHTGLYSTVYQDDSYVIWQYKKQSL